MAKIITLKTKRVGEEKIEQAKAKKRGSVKIGLMGAGFLMIVSVILGSAFYLFQVNDLAMKGYEIRDWENRIAELKKENKKMQIREMELRSMYAMEKVASDFNLVNPTNVSYLELNGPVALK